MNFFQEEGSFIPFFQSIKENLADRRLFNRRNYGLHCLFPKEQKTQKDMTVK